MRSSWPSVFSLSNSFQFVLPGPGLAGAVFARVAASWCDALTCILYLHVLAAFCLWSAISSGTVDRGRSRSSSWYWSFRYPPLLPLFSVTPWPLMATSNAIADMLYEWGSLCGHGTWNLAADQELITFHFLLFLLFLDICNFAFWSPVSKF